MTASQDFKKFFCKKRLTQIYIEEIRYKSARGIDHVSNHSFEPRLAENIKIIVRKARNGTYQFSQYREKLISRGAERNPRVISIPTIRDKLVQKAIAEIFKLNFGAQTPLLHQIINEVIVTYRSGLYQSVIRLDVKDFYPSILHDKLIKEIRKKIRKQELLHLIKNAISRKTVSKPNRRDKKTNTKGIPQGLSISNILANIYLSRIDTKYSNLPSLKYFRYVDDILIFCANNDVEKIRADINADCSDLGLTLHDESDNSQKTSSGSVSDGFSYLGYQFENSKVFVRKKSVDNLRESLIKILTNYKYSKKNDLDYLEWVLNLRITGCIFNKSKYGWLFYFSQIDELSMLGALDHFVQTQLKKLGINQLRTKSFLRTYNEITKNLSNTKYIPNFDSFSVDEKEAILVDVFKVKNPPATPWEIEHLFRRIIFKMVKDLERDLVGTS